MVSCFYIVMEVSLNFALIDLYSHSISDILTDETLALKANSIEIVGRIVSGFGLTLLITGSLYKLSSLK